MAHSNIVPIKNTRDWKFYAERISTAWGKQVESIIETGRALIESKNDPGMEHGSFEMMIKTKLPFGHSTANKLMKIARNTVLTKSEHVPILPASWGAIYQLTLMPQEVLQEKIADGTINPNTSRRDVMRMIASIGQPTIRDEPTEKITSNRSGARINLPAGVSAEDHCRRGLDLASGGMSSTNIAAELKVSPDTYSKMRDIVLLRDRQDLSADDSQIVADAVEEMNETQTVQRPYEKIKHIADRVWGENKKGGTREQAEARRLQSFEDGLSVITQACSCGENMDVPQLSEGHRKQFRKDVQIAINHLRNLLRRIEETGK